MKDLIVVLDIQLVGYEGFANLDWDIEGSMHSSKYARHKVLDSIDRYFGT